MDKRLFDLLILGCGYLGRRVAERATRAGRTVAAVTRSREKAVELAKAGITPIEGDLFGELQLPQAVAVVHAVSMNRGQGMSIEAFVGEGLRRTLAALPPPQGKRSFVYISSTSVYGQSDGGWVDESSETKPTSPGGLALLKAEEVLLRQAQADPAFRPIVLRFAGIYGPGRLLRAEAIRAGQPLPTDPDAWLNLIHVEDGAAIVHRLLGEPAATGVFNVVDLEPVRRGDFYRLLAKLLGAPEPTFAPPDHGFGTGHDAANRRVSGEKLRQCFGTDLRYPNWRSGLPNAVAKT